MSRTQVEERTTNSYRGFFIEYFRTTDSEILINDVDLERKTQPCVHMPRFV